jgi:purine-binding chemotaxis protein CheW
VRHVVFRLERDRYALPLSAIREVVQVPARYTRVPRAPPSLRGVMNLRGRVVPVIDLRQLLELGPGPAATPCLRIVLLELGRRDLGLLVTDVDGIESIEKVLPSSQRSSPSVRGLARLGALALTVLDPEGLDALVARTFTRS